MKFIFTYLLALISSLAFAQKNSILWQAEKDDVKIYLLGANHLYPADSISNKEKINALIKNSDLFISELDMRNDIRDSIFYSRKDNQIERYLGKKDFKIYKALFPEDRYILKLSPAEILLKLYRKEITISCGFEDVELMETYFDNQVERANIPILSFESMIDQISSINNFYTYPEKQIWQLIKNNIKKLSTNNNSGVCTDKALINKNNYVFDFEKEIPEKQNQVWDERNFKWILTLDDILVNNEYKTIFIKVGIGHLDYSNGLIMLLKKKGYQLNPIIF